ncbi:MAG: tRNA(Ile2) 2-agmatinylcytidine synthetase TiaS [Candidatus Thorarchaeota archaeon]|nr:MAG: tRNA(Ile2) 2-agmatinylcytidine synthetase TiaS [Candidatus Thorarchaeota archaeon]
MDSQVLHIGMDDIDSPQGGCTTHFVSLMVNKLENLGVEWCDYPNLIRLNPNIPFRTRGNGAVALRISTECSSTEILAVLNKAVSSYVQKNHHNTNPGIVIVPNEIPEILLNFSQTAIWRAVPVDYAERILQKYDWNHLRTGTGRGIIGALAAVGNTLVGDHTYELITYRNPNECYLDRDVDPESVYDMDSKFPRHTFSNVDPQTGQILIEPHGPDPVLFGIRGEYPVSLRIACGFVYAGQQIQRWCIFRSNQGTGEHLQHKVMIAELRPYMAAVVEGQVIESPRIIEGGHVIFTIRDSTGSIECAAYEPTGDFRNIVRSLIPGDKVLLHTGVKPASRTHGMTLNVEGLEVLHLAENISYFNPICPDCGKRLKSAGRNKGFKCEKCGYRSTNMRKIESIELRTVSTGLYLPPLRAHRHLTRPIARIGRYNDGRSISLIPRWHSE